MSSRRLAVLASLTVLVLSVTSPALPPARVAGQSEPSTPPAAQGTVAPAAAPAEAETPGGDTRPDIIVVYIDDVPPHDGRLWSDPRRTPTLARLFVETATTFELAIGETPLCCPGRAALLTGLHTANHGVLLNDVAFFDPRVTLATALDAVGYQTFWVGKYMNGLRDGVTARDVRRHARGWDVFDVVYENNGRYYDYDLWTRDGIERYGGRAVDHSTRMVERRTVDHLRAADPDAPIFAVMSIFNLHHPNRAIRRFEGDRRCRDVAPWAPPSFNEPDVSDKPRYVAEREPLRRRSWPMTGYCEEMLGIDRAVARVVTAQRRRGRLDDTLLILTADNGATWGAHRLGQMKGVPYATPVPLAMRWPARWGTSPRAIPEVVSNIDLAPTICDIAGCRLGPFRGGPEGADGLSLLPLLDGRVGDLGRDAVREEGGPQSFRPAFRGLRTTPSSPLGRWHYVEYETGERELYDSTADPWELENVAGDPAYAGVVAALSERLRAEFAEVSARSEG